MEKQKKLSCYVSQCCYWDEPCGCTLRDDVDNGTEPCEKCEEIYEYKAYVIVEGGMVTHVYSDKPPSDMCIEVLDLDAAKQNAEDPNALNKMRKRIKNIISKYHQNY